MNAAAQLLDTNLLKKLKKEYGGLQTLLRNEHQVFKGNLRCYFISSDSTHIMFTLTCSVYTVERCVVLKMVQGSCSAVKVIVNNPWWACAVRTTAVIEIQCIL